MILVKDIFGENYVLVYTSVSHIHWLLALHHNFYWSAHSLTVSFELIAALYGQ